MGKSKKQAREKEKKEQKQAKKETKTVVNELKQLAVTDERAAKTLAALHPILKKAKAEKFDKRIARYACTLVDPEHCKFRPPYGFSYPTATATTYQTIDVVGNYSTASAAADKGRFFLQFSPNVGGTAYVTCKESWSTVEPVPLNSTIEVSVLGCATAYYGPQHKWDPANSFNGTAPVMSSSKSLAPPPITTGTNYITIADPQSDRLGGTEANQYDDGFAQKIRPLAMTAWFQFEGDTLVDGGAICGALLPAGSTAGQIVPLNPLSGTPSFTGMGPLQNYENLANVPGNYQGRLNQGCFVWWSPQSISDITMTDVASSIMTDFPTIVMSGQTTKTDGSLIGRVRVIRMYEYVTTEQLVSTDYTRSILGGREAVDYLLYDQPHAMSNDEHKTWQSMLIRGALGGIAGAAAGAAAGPPGMVAGFVAGASGAILSS